MNKSEKEELASIIDDLYENDENGGDSIVILERLYRTVKKMIKYNRKDRIN